MNIKERLPNFKDGILLKLNSMIKFIGTYIAEFFVISGAFFIVFATFKINRTAGYYSLSAVLLASGIFFSHTRR